VDRQIRNLRARLQDDWRKRRFIAIGCDRGHRFLQCRVAGGIWIVSPVSCSESRGADRLAVNPRRCAEVTCS
jgi:hypothetical protein